MNTSKAAAEQLKHIPAGFLQPDLFNEIARLGVLAYLELIAFRLNPKDEVEVLLTQRGVDDKFWPSLYHNPGTVLRPNDLDMTFNSALLRLFNDEYAKQVFNDGPFFAGFWFEQLERGKGLGIVSWVELSESSVGKYFPVKKLPENIIKGQDRYIKKAAEHFKQYKRGNFNPTPLEQLILQ